MKKLSLLICFIVMISFVGCYTPHFLPNTAPITSFEKAGNVRFGGYAGTNSYDVYVGVSPINNIGIVGSGSYSSSKKVDNEENNKKPDNEAEYTHGHRYFEGALVYYFTPIKIKSEIFKIEILGGYGKGTVNGSIDSGKRDKLGIIIPTTKVEADYRQYYLQFNAGINNTDYNNPSGFDKGGMLEYGTVFRLSNTKFSNFRKDENPLKLNPMEGTFLQTGLFGTVGGSGTGLTVQAGWLFVISNNANRPSYSPLFVAAGLRLGLW